MEEQTYEVIIKSTGYWARRVKAQSPEEAVVIVQNWIDSDDFDLGECRVWDIGEVFADKVMEVK